MDLGRVMAVGRWTLIGGLLLTSLSFLVGVSFIGWTGVGIAALGLFINTAGKFARYSRLPIPSVERVAIMAAWLLLVLTIAGLVFDYASDRLTPGYESRFWALLLASVGFAAIYYGLRVRFVPDDPEQ